jgi:hypothetical protein
MRLWQACTAKLASDEKTAPNILSMLAKILLFLTFLLCSITAEASSLDATPTVFDTLGPNFQFDAAYYQVGGIPAEGSDYRTAAQFTASVTGNLDVVYLAVYGPNGVEASTAVEAYLYQDGGEVFGNVGSPDEGSSVFLGSVAVAWFQYYPPSAYSYPLYWFNVTGTAPVVKGERYWLVLKQGTPTGSYAWNKSLPSVTGPVFQSVDAGPWAPAGSSPQVLPTFKLTARDVVGATFSEWQTSHFSQSQLNDDSISGWAADPNSDGIPNAFEYYFNFEPLSAITPTESAALPGVSLQTVIGVSTAGIEPRSVRIDYAFFTYRKRIGSPVTENVCVSDDLLTWDETGKQVPQYGSATLTSDNISETVTAALNLNGTDHKQKFFRLKITPAHPSAVAPPTR